MGGFMFIPFNGLTVRTLLVFIALSTVSCQSTYSTNREFVPLNTKLYFDVAFPQFKSYEIETEDEVFALDDAMKAMVHDKLLSERDTKKRAKKLLKQLFSKENIDLAYKATANLTASQAYHNQTANCMSLTIMAYALAKEAELDVKFQDVKVPEYWVRNGEYNMLTGHVNLVLTEKRTPNKMVIYGRELLQIDFDPAVYKKSFPKRIVEKNTVLAMFYNNKGAEALVSHNYPLAYAYLREATTVDPMFSSGWGNLGILYKLTGNIDYALKSYDHAIFLDKNNLTALSNLSYLLRSTGDTERATEIESLLHDKRSSNPYYHALLGDEALFRGENKNALRHYKRAIRMDKKIHEFHFGIAKVHYAMNDVKSAEKALRMALAYNRASAIDHQYTAKLNFLRQAELRD